MNEEPTKNFLEILKAYSTPRTLFIDLKFNVMDAPEECRSTLDEMFNALDMVGWNHMGSARVEHFCRTAMEKRNDLSFRESIIFTWQLAQELAKEKEKRKVKNAGRASGRERKEETISILERLNEPITEYLRKMSRKDGQDRPLKKIIVDELLAKYGEQIKKVREEYNRKQDDLQFLLYYIREVVKILRNIPQSQRPCNFEIQTRKKRSEESKEKSRQGALRAHGDRKGKK